MTDVYHVSYMTIYLMYRVSYRTRLLLYTGCLTGLLTAVYRVSYKTRLLLYTGYLYDWCIGCHT